MTSWVVIKIYRFFSARWREQPRYDVDTARRTSCLLRLDMSRTFLSFSCLMSVYVTLWRCDINNITRNRIIHWDSPELLVFSVTVRAILLVTNKLNWTQTSHWDCGTVRMWECETVRLWDCETVRMWECEIVRLWECETVRLWECETVRLPPSGPCAGLETVITDLPVLNQFWPLKVRLYLGDIWSFTRYFHWPLGFQKTLNVNIESQVCRS